MVLPTVNLQDHSAVYVRKNIFFHLFLGHGGNYTTVGNVDNKGACLIKGQNVCGSLGLRLFHGIRELGQ